MGGITESSCIVLAQHRAGVQVGVTMFEVEEVLKVTASTTLSKTVFGPSAIFASIDLSFVGTLSGVMRVQGPACILYSCLYKEEENIMKETI